MKRKRSLEVFEAFVRKNKAKSVRLAMIGAVIFAGEGGGGLLWGEDRGAAEAALPEVVVRGEEVKPYKPKSANIKYTQSLRDIPQTVTVIPKAVMQDQNTTTLRDVLRNVPGISMQAGEGGVPAGDNLSIRGFSARTDIFIDGVRDFGGYSRDSFNMEQVEISKGPSSANGGRGSTGGTINQISKGPLLEAFTEGSAAVGNEEYKRVSVDLNRTLPNGKLAGVAMRLNAMWHDGETPGRDEVRGNRWGAAPSLAFGLGTPTEVKFYYFYLGQENIPDYGIPWVTATNNALVAYRNKPAPVARENFYGLKSRDYEKTDTNVWTALVEHKLSEESSLRYQLRYGRAKRNSMITAPRFVSDSSSDINRQLQSRDMVDTIFSNQAGAAIKFETYKVPHEFLLGFEFAAETSINLARSANSAPNADLYKPNVDVDYVPNTVYTGARTEGDAKSSALYAFDTIKVAESLELTGGLRWDSIDADYRTVSTTGTITPIKRIDKIKSWRAGVVYKPAVYGSFYASYGTSFNPSSESLALTTTTATVDPEMSRTLEVGTKWDLLSERLALSGAFFKTEKTNARTAGINAGDLSTVLAGEQRVEGAELGLAGTLRKEWKVYAGYTWLQSEIVKSNTNGETGKVLPQTPENSFNLWTTYQFPFGLDLGVGVQFVDKRYGNNTNTREVGSYLLGDFMCSYPVAKNADLRLNVTNVADTVYFDSLGGGHLIPGAGRSLVLSTGVKF